MTLILTTFTRHTKSSSHESRRQNLVISLRSFQYSRSRLVLFEKKNLLMSYFIACVSWFLETSDVFGVYIMAPLVFGMLYLACTVFHLDLVCHLLSLAQNKNAREILTV